LLRLALDVGGQDNVSIIALACRGRKQGLARHLLKRATTDRQSYISFSANLNYRRVAFGYFSLAFDAIDARNEAVSNRFAPQVLGDDTPPTSIRTIERHRAFRSSL
jgi:hypothetical protein